MAGDEELPATLTPREEALLSQSQGSTDEGLQKPWGRLLSNRMYWSSVDLVGQTFSFGRSENCSLVITKRTMSQKDANLFESISKRHFEIFKNVKDNLIYIRDCSKNGTHVSNRRLNKGQMQILKTGDQISLFEPPKKFYLFQRTDGEELDKLLPIELSARYAFVKAIGRGAAGEVFLVKDRQTCQPYAIKKIIKSARNTSQMDKINHPTKIENEIHILKSLNHPSIIKLIEILEDENVAYIILEYMEGGDLYPRIVDQEFDFSEDLAKFYFYQMALGVNYLHNEGFSHRDLKPENLLLLSDDLETVLKITDFGLSKNAENDDLTTMCGTYKYVAPEVICSSFRSYGEYGKEADVWSMGVILYFMLSKTYPFNAPDNNTLRKQIVMAQYSFDEKYWSHISKEAKDLIKRMLVVYPKHRIKLEDVFRHKWLNSDLPMKYRVSRLIQSHMPLTAMESESQEPPEKKFKFTVFSRTNSDTDSGDSDATMKCYDSFSTTIH